MANVNFFELEACLSSLLIFCDKHPRRPYVIQYKNHITKVDEHLRDTVTNTDNIYNNWRVEKGEDKLAYKHLQLAYKRIQVQLHELGVTGYPTQVVEYWYPDDTEEAARQLLAFVEEHKNSLDFAEDAIAELKKLLDGAVRGASGTKDALHSYQQVAASRKLAMELAQDVIKELRPLVRRDFGREDETYLSVRWPAMLDPDPM